MFRILAYVAIETNFSISVFLLFILIFDLSIPPKAPKLHFLQFFYNRNVLMTSTVIFGNSKISTYLILFHTSKTAGCQRKIVQTFEYTTFCKKKKRRIRKKFELFFSLFNLNRKSFFRKNLCCFFKKLLKEKNYYNNKKHTFRRILLKQQLND